MDYFGINSTDDLPKIKEVLAEQAVQGTLIEDAINNHVETEDIVSDESMLDDSGTALIVSDNGQLIEQPLPVDFNEEEIINLTAADNDSFSEDEQPSAENTNTPDDNDEEKKVKRDEDSPNDQLRDSSSNEPKAE
jgi:segregation and condensation protein B